MGNSGESRELGTRGDTNHEKSPVRGRPRTECLMFILKLLAVRVARFQTTTTKKMGTHNKKIIVYLKLKCNWVSWVLSGFVSIVI